MADPRTDSERLAVIERSILHIERQLFGNGQPGQLDRIKARLRRLERWAFIVIGGAAVLLWIVEHYRT